MDERSERVGRRRLLLPADLGNRFNAFLLDCIALGIVQGIAFSLFRLRPPTYTSYTGLFKDRILDPGRNFRMPETWAELTPAAWLVFALLPGFLVLQAVLLARRGQSLGKLASRVRIVDARDSSPVGFVRIVLVRFVFLLAVALGLNSLSFQLGNLTVSLGFLLLLIDVLWVFGKEGRCLHDHLARTKVVSWPRRASLQAPA
ncbi:MAG: RDD family protein [Planctomycetes bacterium]|nr:RDD family protein [Planctomycetota bacterium]